MDDDTKIDICGYVVTGWKATAIFIGIIAAIFFAGVSLGTKLM